MCPHLRISTVHNRHKTELLIFNLQTGEQPGGLRWDVMGFAWNLGKDSSSPEYRWGGALTAMRLLGLGDPLRVTEWPAKRTKTGDG